MSAERDSMTLNEISYSALYPGREFIRLWPMDSDGPPV